MKEQKKGESKYDMFFPSSCCKVRSAGIKKTERSKI